MSDMNNKTEVTNKNNELVVSTGEEAISENLWIIRVSKTHPGLKYYFNTVTGVSLWNISREDMERAKLTMKANGNQPQYSNYPEPMEPPPSKNSTINPLTHTYCDHVPQQFQNSNGQAITSRLARETSQFTCDICYPGMNSPPNVITVNLRQCPHPAYNSLLSNTCTISESFNQFQSSPALLHSAILQNNNCNKNKRNLLAKNGSLNRRVVERIDPDPSIEQLPNQTNTDCDSLDHSTRHIGKLDLTPLKVFAKNGVCKDKWYIIADTNVYLNHITLLKSVLISDNQCSLMVPRNVKVELEVATKTELRTKAHYASYYIYKMFDNGFAQIDEDNSIDDKSNEEYVLDCCSKLKEKNFYVVVISNDIELQKYRNKIYIPIFTVAELKEYLNKNNSTISPEPSGVTKSSNNLNIFPPNNLSMPSNKLPFMHTSLLTNLDTVLKRNQNVQASFMCNDIGTQVDGFCDVFERTDVEVQTDYNSIQIEETKKVLKEMYASNRFDTSKRKDISIGNIQSCEPPLNTSSIQGPSKRIKLRRKKVLDQTMSNLSTNLANSLSERTEFSNTRDTALSKFVNQRNKKSNIHNNLRAADTTAKNFEEEKYTNLKQTCDPYRGITMESKLHKNNFDNQNVMFEVTTEMMDYNLKNKCDEYVSRFVQIMEEALAQVLRKNTCSYLPPPWNMYEAAICIEKRFTNDEDVADASNKFLNILNRLCDEKGNINANISPTEYMEMYSFGVYIIDALQGIFSSCEDLQSAAESLSKLLSDIQDPDVRNLEQFHSISQEDHVINDVDNPNDNVEVLMIIETKSVSDDMSIENTEHLTNVTDVVTSVNVLNNNAETSKTGSSLRITVTNSEFSNDITQNENHTSKNQCRFKSVNIECNDKSQEDNNIIGTETPTARNTFSVSSTSGYNHKSRPLTMSSKKQDNQSVPKENNLIQNDVCKSTFNSNTSIPKNIAKRKPQTFDDSLAKNITTDEISNRSEGFTCQFNSNEPKIVRNFVICSEFENRLSAKCVHDGIGELDHEEELAATDYVDEDESYGDTERFQIDEFPEFHHNRHMEVKTTRSTEIVEIDFKHFIRRIAQEIQDLSFEVYTFSQNASEVLNSFSTIDDKSLIRERAEQIHSTINDLCTALNNILNRDKNGGYNMQALLIKAKFEDISLNENQMKTYREFIARCLEQAHDLKNTIKDILSAVCL